MREIPKEVTCEYCGETMPNDPGSFYHNSACEVNYVLYLLEREADPEKRKKLERRLEMARYVGD